MRKLILICFSLICCFACLSEGATFESLSIINAKNWGAYFADLLGYPYDSHGCLHLTPSDIYLLTKTIPAGTSLKVKPYKLPDKELVPDFKELPYFAALVNNQADLLRQAELFKSLSTEVVVYPSFNKLLICLNGKPYVQVNALAGPKEPLLMAYDVQAGQPVEWDFMLTTPTDAGNYRILRSTDHYISSAYYKNTVVPFGAWLVKRNNGWVFQENNNWYKLPEYVAADLARPLEQQQYHYYDVSPDGKAARWAGHDFGRDVLLWTKDGKNHYPEMAYAAGELLYEQITLVKDLVHILTLPGPDDLAYCVNQNKDFVFYQGLYDFVQSKGKIAPAEVAPQVISYYRLYNHWPLSSSDYKLIDPRVLKAFTENEENRLPRDTDARRRALGLYHFLRLNSLVVDKQAHYYGALKRDWPFYQDLRARLRGDFNKMGILALENRQNVVEQWLTNRLEFKTALLPRLAKNLEEQSFTTFFQPKDESALFYQRERQVMAQLLNQLGSQEAENLEIHSVKALNDYNFGLLLNEILGDLYRSHGCLHVSPRNIYFLYTLLPMGAQISVYDYEKELGADQLKAIPYLTDLVNFADDLENLKQRFAVTSEVIVAVYPLSGYWLVYLKGQPFAKLQVKGGPKQKMYLVQGRNQAGQPVFEQHLAYPTSPGTYHVWRKVENYLSKIYRDTTIIPMGGEIKKEGKKWLFKTSQGKWQPVPYVIQNDLSVQPGQREYLYYDPSYNLSGEVVAVKWGSQPFGRYAIQTSKDGRRPFPELIHSSGDLMMEERQLIDDLIKVLSAPYDELDQCVKSSQNFELYKACFDFTKNPGREDLIQAKERANYKLYQGLPLTSDEAKMLPPDTIIAAKLLDNKELTQPELELLLAEGVAARQRGKIAINWPKVIGLRFDTYQYVVTIEKYAHHYETIRKHWQDLSSLRQALLADFKNFVIKDPKFFPGYVRELMLARTNLEKITKDKAIELLRQMLDNNGT